MLPQVGQGAIAVECRADDGESLRLLEPLDQVAVRRAVDAERAFLAAVGGACELPVAGHATFGTEGELRMEGLVAAPDGTVVVRRGAVGPPECASELGREVADMVLTGGGRRAAGGPGGRAMSAPAGASETGPAGVPEGGAVYLVGAGPGDPGLLTRRGAEALATADVVVHDRLTDTDLLALAPPSGDGPVPVGAARYVLLSSKIRTLPASASKFSDRLLGY